MFHVKHTHNVSRETLERMKKMVNITEMILNLKAKKKNYCIRKTDIRFYLVGIGENVRQQESFETIEELTNFLNG